MTRAQAIGSRNDHRRRMIWLFGHRSRQTARVEKLPRSVRTYFAQVQNRWQKTHMAHRRCDAGLRDSRPGYEERNAQDLFLKIAMKRGMRCPGLAMIRGDYEVSL